jgi:tetratricopeptide (TPR) repeat protein
LVLGKSGAAAGARRAPGLADGQLLERQGEQAALEALIAGSCAGLGRLVAVEGAAGIGKTALLGQARAEAERMGMGVLTTRGSPLEREFAPGVVRQLFEPVLAAASASRRKELLAGSAGQAATLLGQADAAIAAEGGDSSLAVLHGLFWLTANLCAPRPLVLVVVAVRPAEPSVDQHLVTQIVLDPSAVLVHPAPLSQAASARLVRSLLTDEASEQFCAACHAATGGNPLLLRELASAAAAEGIRSDNTGKDWLAELAPRAVGRRVALRLAQLGRAAAALTRAVAVLGEGADPAQAATLAGLGTHEAFEAASQLAAVEILRPLEHGARAASCCAPTLGFVHPLVQAAVYEGLSAAQRIQAHSCAARVLTQAGAAPERIAAHLLNIPPADNPAVVAVLRQAAEQALLRGAPDSAVVYLERCLAEPPPAQQRGAVLIQLGTVAQLVDMTKAAQHLSAALPLIQQPQQRALIAEMLGHALFFLGRNEQAIAVLTQALTETEQYPPLHRQLQASLLVAAQNDPALGPLAAEWTSQRRDEPPDEDLSSRLLDCMIAGYDAYLAAPATAVVGRARRGLAGIRGQANCFRAFSQGCAVLMAADLDEIMPLLDASLAQAYQRGSIYDLAGAKSTRAVAWLWRGFLAEAETDARDAVRAVQTARLNLGRPYAVATLALALMEQGRLAEAEATLDWASQPDEVPTIGHCLRLLGRAHLLILQQRTEQGLEAMLAYGQRMVAYGLHNPAFSPWRSTAALALLSLGRRQLAHALAAEELALARRWGAPRALGRSLRVAGLIHSGQQGIALLRQAVEVLAPCPARLEHAKTQVELGAAIRRAGHRTEARQHLRHGIDLAQLCGATPLVARGLAELRAPGASDCPARPH